MKTLALLAVGLALAAPARAATTDDWVGSAQAQLNSALKAFKDAIPRPPAGIPDADGPRFAVIHVMVPTTPNADPSKLALDRAAGIEQLTQTCKGRLEDLDAQPVGERVELATNDGQILHLIQLCKTPGPSDDNYILLHTRDSHYFYGADTAEKSAKQKLIDSCTGMAPDAELVPGFVSLTTHNFVDTIQACRYKKPY